MFRRTAIASMLIAVALFAAGCGASAALVSDRTAMTMTTTATIYERSVTVTSAELKAPGQYGIIKELIANPGTGKRINIISGYAKLTATEYETGQVFICTGAQPTIADLDLRLHTAPNLYLFAPTNGFVGNPADFAGNVTLRADEVPTGGTGDLSVTLYYTVVSI
jgi:hypothetical protein